MTALTIFAIILITGLVFWKLLNPPKNDYSFEDYENQLALDEYLKRDLDTDEMCKLYERQIGYVLESAGYYVEYLGALKGTEDLGRDLIVRKGDEVSIVQVKFRHQNTVIEAQCIHQLYGSAEHFRRKSKKSNCVYNAVFYSTTSYSDHARDAARALQVLLITRALDRSYPMIKCNISGKREKHYYLPTDDRYDKVRGDFYVHTVGEAVEKGFRSAPKFRIKVFRKLI